MPNFIGQVPCVSSNQDSRVDGKIKDIWDLKDGEKSLSGHSVIWLKPATSGKWTFRADLLLGRTLEIKFQNFILNSLRIPMVLLTMGKKRRRDFLPVSYQKKRLMHKTTALLMPSSRLHSGLQLPDWQLFFPMYLSPLLSSQT